MAKASPAVRSFNAGVFSALMGGRTDLDRYPASLQDMHNYVAAPQGPAIARSGTSFLAEAYGDAGRLVPFIFSDDQALQIEVSTDRIRFHTEGGTVVRASVAGTVALSEPFAIEAPGLGASVGEEIAVTQADPETGLTGAIFKVTAKVGDEYVLDGGDPAYAGAISVARVYHVPATFTADDLKNLRYLQKIDVVYLMFGTRPVMTLSRYGTYDWRLKEVEFIDGPYLETNDGTVVLYPNRDGGIVPPLNSNTDQGFAITSSGNRPLVGEDAEFLGRTPGYTMQPAEPYWAFDYNSEISWAGNNRQGGWLQVQFPAPKIVDGYAIAAPTENKDATYLSGDFAPSDWTLLGSNDGVNFVTIDIQRNYVLYDQGKSVFFELKDPTAYTYIRILIHKLVRNGSIEPRINKLILREKNGPTINMVASGTTGINRDQGFLATDVGRLIRVRGDDTVWRSVRIVAVNSTTNIDVKLLGEPLPNPSAIREWRLGAWSYTTGFPSVGDFHEDRLFLCATTENPDLVCGSVTGKYETFSQTDAYGAVLDESAIVVRPNSKKLSRIRWLAADEKGLLFGSGSQEFVLTTSDGGALTARNPKVVSSTSRGSANVEPVKVDRQVLYAQRSGRNIREMAYVYEADGYKSPSMSQLASHLGIKRFVQIEYAQEPYGIAWIRRDDGSVVGLTYNRDENVIGWHTHDFSGGVVEDMSILPTADQLQDALWIIARREVNGEQRRYIEKLERFWDFDMSIQEAQFVDCALRYNGEPTDIIYGLSHLEGREVYGLADTRPVGPYTVVNGSVELEFAASNVVLGLGFDAFGVTSRLENGAADGTAQGKVKRINSIVLLLWASAGGEVGVHSDETQGIVYDALDYPGDNSEIEELALYDGFIGPLTPAPGYEMDGVVSFRRPKESPLPFNIIAILPQLNTQDR